MHLFSTLMARSLHIISSVNNTSVGTLRWHLAVAAVGPGGNPIIYRVLAILRDVWKRIPSVLTGEGLMGRNLMAAHVVNCRMSHQSSLARPGSPSLNAHSSPPWVQPHTGFQPPQALLLPPGRVSPPLTLLHCIPSSTHKTLPSCSVWLDLFHP